MQSVRHASAVFILSFTLLLTLLYAFAGDRYAWSEYFTIWPAFCWLLVLAPGVALGWSRRWLRLSIAMLVAVVGFTLAFNEWRTLLRFASPARTPETLRLASWNIHDGRAGEPALFAARLAPLDPDVVLFQEVHPNRAAFTPERLPPRWAAYHWWSLGDCALLSRYPFERIELPEFGPRAPLVALLTLPGGRRLLLANIHPPIPELAINPFAREQRHALKDRHKRRTRLYRAYAAEITRLRAEHPDAEVIFAGDFNTHAAARSLEPLAETSLRDVWPAAGRGWGATFHAALPTARIDQCWTSAGITPRDAFVLDGAPSDHRILVVDFDL